MSRKLCCFFSFEVSKEVDEINEGTDKGKTEKNRLYCQIVCECMCRVS
jgi:hypothetical protein